MRITKFEHSFLAIESGGETLVVDPGKFTAELPQLQQVVGIVLTHLHDDHTYLPHVTALRAQFPGIPVFGPQGVADTLGDAVPVTVVAAGDGASVGAFSVEFYGGRHAIIHRSIPQIDNVGVFVNDTLYYPGDSFALPGRPVPVLAVPSSAPWLKVAEVMDFVTAVAPAQSFPAHDFLWAPAGTALANARIADVTAQIGGRFTPLTPGESLVV